MTTQTKVLLGLALLAISASTAAWALGDRPDARGAASERNAQVRGSRDGLRRVSAPGRIEGAADAVEIGTTLDGRLAEIRVAEGERVERGQPLAVLDCSELAAQGEALRARRAGALASLARLRRGGRPDARYEAQARVDAAAAASGKAAADERRASALWDERVISREEFERASTASRLAEAEWREAQARMSVVVAEPLPEDIAELAARVAEVAAGIAAIDARLAHCVVRAPAPGTVLRVHKHVGETVSQLRGEPIVTVADTRRLRVRAEVDEVDALLIQRGMVAIVTADALEERELRGRVVSVLGLMGRRTVVSGDPADKSDRDVLEVLVELEPSDEMPVVGLRVRVLFGESPVVTRDLSR